MTKECQKGILIRYKGDEKNEEIKSLDDLLKKTQNNDSSNISSIEVIKQAEFNQRIIQQLVTNLNKLPNVTSLTLHACEIVYDWTIYLSTLNHIKKLDVSGNTNIKNNGLKNISKIRSLRELNVSNCGLSNGAIETLKEMRQLSGLSATQNNFIKEKIKDFGENIKKGGANFTKCDIGCFEYGLPKVTKTKRFGRIRSSALGGDEARTRSYSEAKDITNFLQETNNAIVLFLLGCLLTYDGKDKQSTLNYLCGPESTLFDVNLLKLTLNFLRLQN